MGRRPGACRAAEQTQAKAFRLTPEGIAARRAIEIQSRHGITQVAFDALFHAQQGKCAICDEPFTPYVRNTPSGGRKPACVDHDHATGKIRGLLCRGCNTGEGWVAKRYGRLQAYLASPPAEILDIA